MNRPLSFHFSLPFSGRRNRITGMIALLVALVLSALQPGVTLAAVPLPPSYYLISIGSTAAGTPIGTADDSASGGSACTLRDALAISNAGATTGSHGCLVSSKGGSPAGVYVINLPNPGYAYTLNGSELLTTANRVLIYGGGPLNDTTSNLMVPICSEFEGCYRVLHNTGANVTLSSIVVGNGNTMGTATDKGGNIYNESGTLTLDASTVTSGTATLGGGIYNNATLILQSGSSVNSNSIGLSYLESASYGGGIYNTGNTTIIASQIVNNYAFSGGGIYNLGTLTVRGVSTIPGEVSNNAASTGGGIYNAGTTILETGTATVNGNQASILGGGIYNTAILTIRSSAVVESNVASLAIGGGGGGGIYNAASGTVTVDAGIIRYNYATWSDDIIEGEGGGIYNAGDLVIRNRSSILRNSAFAGGGVYNTGSATVINSTISESYAGIGAGIYNTASLTIQSGSIVGGPGAGNNAFFDSRFGTTGFGGGLYNLSGSASVTNSTISGNLAGQSGGGFYTAGGTVTVSGSQITNNTSLSASGSAVYHSGGSTSVTGSCVIANNTEAVTNGSLPPVVQNFSGNWWGAPSGPGQVDTASANVDTSGFLSTPILGCPQLAGAPDTATVPGSYYLIAAGGTSAGSTIGSANDSAWGGSACTLRDALVIVNAGSITGSNGCTVTAIPAGSTPTGVYVINLPAYTYTLGSSAELRTTANTLFIMGSGTGNSILQASTCDPTSGACAGAQYPVLYNRGGTITLSRVTVRNGGSNSSGRFGGIWNETGTVTIDASTITSNWNGGIYNAGAVIVQNNSTIINNWPNIGGIYNLGILLVRGHSSITGNRTTGIQNFYGSVIIDASTISANVGAGILNNYGRLVVRNGSLITSNGGSGIGNASGYAIIDASTISGNTALSGGGGISNHEFGTLIVRNGSVIGGPSGGNTGRTGGGIFNRGTLTVIESTLANNIATFGGGGIFNGPGTGSEGTLTVIDSTIANNTAPIGGGIYNATVSDPNLRVVTVTLDNSVVAGNQATGNGGGIFNMSILNILNGSLIGGPGAGNSAGSDGGGILNQLGTVNINGSTVSANMANRGGGISNVGTLNIVNGSLIGGADAGNVAWDRGGGINQVSGIALVDDSTISANTALSGGGIYNSSATLTIQNGSVVGGVDAGNSAQTGGGIYDIGTLIMTGSQILSNTASDIGGAIFHEAGGTSSITGSCIVGNSAEAVTVSTSTNQNFTANWWGNASGPGPVGPGTGDTVSTFVDFSGFVTTGCLQPPATNTPTATPTSTETPTATPTDTETPTATPTDTETPTATSTDTETPTATATDTDTPTATSTGTETPADTPTATPTDTETPTATPTDTETPTATPTDTETPTATPTDTETPTATSTDTETPTATSTDTETPTATSTSTNTPTATSTNTNTPTATPTPSGTPIQMTQALISEIRQLITSGQIRRRDGNALITTLRVATAEIRRGHPNAARAVLRVFINEVRVLRYSGRISASNAQALINSARDIISAIGP